MRNTRTRAPSRTSRWPLRAGRWLAPLVGLLLVLPGLASAADVTVAAASSLVHVLPEVARDFERRSGHRLRISYGSSGNLARQILQGAPFDIFLSANRLHERYIQSVAQGPGQVFALGRLVAYVNLQPPPADLSGLVGAYREGRIRRLAIANPQHAPYGFAAREVLEAQGLWDTISAQLVLGETVAQAAQFAATGSVEAALLALSLVRSDNFKGGGDYFIVPANLHMPIEQTLIMLKRSSAAAREFAQFLSGPHAAPILAAHGFEQVGRLATGRTRTD